MDPYQILQQVMPHARSEEELIAMAAELGDPPPPAGAPPAAMPNPSGVGLQGMPQSALVPQAGPNIVPPMTQGESRTALRLGDTLLGV